MTSFEQAMDASVNQDKERGTRKIFIIGNSMCSESKYKSNVERTKYNILNKLKIKIISNIITPVPNPLSGHNIGKWVLQPTHSWIDPKLGKVNANCHN